MIGRTSRNAALASRPRNNADNRTLNRLSQTNSRQAALKRVSPAKVNRANVSLAMENSRRRRNKRGNLRAASSRRKRRSSNRGSRDNGRVATSPIRARWLKGKN